MAASLTTLLLSPAALAWAPCAYPQLPAPSRSRPVLLQAAGTYDSQDWFGDDAAASQARRDETTEGGPPNNNNGLWQSIGGCDVLFPEDECVAVLHFVGGALVGAAPQQAYGAFLETLGEYGLAVVATPTSQLTGLDHWAAADEVLERWRGAYPEVRRALVDRELARNRGAAEALPVIGVGHSLGAKLLLLLGSEDELVAELGPRAANVLVAFNNYPAAKSVPLLTQASELSRAAAANVPPGAIDDALQGLGDAGAALDGALRSGAASLADSLGATAPELRDLGRGASGGVNTLLDALQDVGAAAAGAPTS